MDEIEAKQERYMELTRAADALWKSGVSEEHPDLIALRQRAHRAGQEAGWLKPRDAQASSPW